MAATRRRARRAARTRLALSTGRIPPPGLAVGTQRIYTQAVHRLAAHHRRSPDQLSEEEVRGYLLDLRQRGVARGTFKTSQYGLRFLYRHTLGRAWGLFGEKKDRLATAEAAA